MKKAGSYVAEESLQGQAFKIRLTTYCPQGEVHYARRVLYRHHARRHALARPTVRLLDLCFSRSLPHHRTRSFDQHVHLANFVVDAGHVAHRPLERKAWSLAHEVHHEVAGGHGNANIRRTDGEGRPKKQ